MLLGLLAPSLVGQELYRLLTLRQKDLSAYDQALRYLAVITLLVLVMVQPVAAQSFKPDYKAGYAAHEQGDYSTALKHWRPLAKQGHANAQHNLGAMYRDGTGVVQDLVMFLLGLVFNTSGDGRYVF